MSTGKVGTVVVPNRWERFLAGQIGCPWCSCCLWFLLGWLFVLIFFAKAAREGTDLISFETQAVIASLTVQEHFGFQAARGTVPGCQDKDHEEEAVCTKDDKCSWEAGAKQAGNGGGASTGTGLCKDKEVCTKPVPREREESLLIDGRPAWVAIIYEAQGEGGDVLDDKMLNYISAFEKELLTDANGAEMSGIKSPWDEDWCKKSFPAGSATTHKGKCSSPSSVLNLFSMTHTGRQATAAQVKEGYTYGGPLSCMCTDEDKLCSLCNSDGTLKSLAEVDVNMLKCMGMRRLSSDSVESALSNATIESDTTRRLQMDMCAGRGMGSMDMTTIIAFLTGFCKQKPSCQWAPPGASLICASTAFYRPTDSNSLVTGADKQAAFNKMCDPENTMWSSLRRQLLPREFDCVSKKSQFARTLFFAGDPGVIDGVAFTDKYIAPQNGWYMQESKLEREIETQSDGDLRIMLFSAATIRSQFLAIFMTDLLLSLGSLVLVWAYMWFSLESAFLASCAMFEIVFSLPVTCSVWAVFFNQKIEFFQMLTIYMILGIGADDAFVLYDAWLQARFTDEIDVNDKGARFAWAYRRSFKAMVVTTATTCGSFLIGAASPLPQVRNFCIFAALVVFIDWVFCETFFASAIMVHDRFIHNPAKQKGTCLGPGCCCGCCRVIAATCCKVKYPPADAAPEKRWMEKFCEGKLFNCLNKCKILLIVVWLLLTALACVSAGVQLRTAEKTPPIGRENLDATRGIEILLKQFSLFGVPTTNVAWGLNKMEPVQEWGNTHDDDIARLDPAEIAKITTPAGQLEVLGLCRAADIGSVDSMRCDSKQCLISGRVKTGQCLEDDKVWKTSGVYVPADILCQTGRYCFMEELARFWAYYVEGEDCVGKKDPVSCPTAGGKCAWDLQHKVCHSTMTETDYKGLPAAEFTAMLASEAFSDYMLTRSDVMNAVGRDFDVYSDKLNTGFRMNSAKTALTFAWVTYNATYPSENSVEEANDIYARWSGFHNKYAPNIGGVQTTDLYLFMVTQNEMVKAAITGVAYSLLISFGVLVLATGNWWVSGLGLINILAISLVFLGLMPVWGWSLGEYECIFLIAVVGLSVDYTVHLLHVYETCKEEDRVSRSRHALAEMGISVTNSAITTLLASVVLFGCGFYFFFMFGLFMFLVIGFSILMSITFLIPLCILIGPQREQGRLPFLSRSCRNAPKE